MGAAGGPRCAGLAVTGDGRLAGGEAGQQALEAAADAVDAVPERDGEAGKLRLAETAGDDGGEQGNDQAEPAGEVGDVEGGGGRGLGWLVFHEYIPSTRTRAGARGMMAGVGPMPAVRRGNAASAEAGPGGGGMAGAGLAVIAAEMLG